MIPLHLGPNVIIVLYICNNFKNENNISQCSVLSRCGLQVTSSQYFLRQCIYAHVPCDYCAVYDCDNNLIKYNITKLCLN